MQFLERALRRHALVLVLVAPMLACLAGDVRRLAPPQRETAVPLMAPGAADFVYAYHASRAWTLGVNPYENSDPRFADPWGRNGNIGGKSVRFFYPPPHLFLYVPLALVFRDDAFAAAPFHLALVLGTLLLLALVTLRLAQEAGGLPRAATPTSVAVIAVLLTLHPSGLLLLERGQSDGFTALACWAGALDLLRGRAARGFVTSVIGASLKGYGGLWVLAFPAMARRPVPRRVILEALAVTAFLGVLFARRLPLAFTAVYARLQAPLLNKACHGFASLAVSTFGLRPAAGLVGTVALLAVLASVVRRWSRVRGQASTSTHALFVAAAAFLALGAAVTAPTVTFVYNLPLYLPGLIVLGLCALTRPSEPAPRKVAWLVATWLVWGAGGLWAPHLASLGVLIAAFLTPSLVARACAADAASGEAGAVDTASPAAAGLARP